MDLYHHGIDKDNLAETQAIVHNQQLWTQMVQQSLKGSSPTALKVMGQEKE